jgi:hypothetical protein
MTTNLKNMGDLQNRKRTTSTPDSVPESGYEAVRRNSHFRLVLQLSMASRTQITWNRGEPGRSNHRRDISMNLFHLFLNEDVTAFSRCIEVWLLLGLRFTLLGMLVSKYWLKKE